MMKTIALLVIVASVYASVIDTGKLIIEPYDGSSTYDALITKACYDYLQTTKQAMHDCQQDRINKDSHTGGMTDQEVCTAIADASKCYESTSPQCTADDIKALEADTVQALLKQLSQQGRTIVC